MKSESFSKLFASIADSSLWDYPHAIRIVWITMLSTADRTGYVGSSIPGLAARARVTIAEVEEALRLFMSPDPYSRSRDHDGRRVAEAPRGWVLLNYERYRNANAEDRQRASKRRYAERTRAAKRAAAAGQADSESAQVSNDTGAEKPPDGIYSTESRYLPLLSSVLDPLRSKSDPDPDQTRAREAEAPSQVRPVLRSGAPLVHWTLDGWELSDELRSEAIAAGVPADEIAGYVEGLRSGPIGGTRGVIDRDAYVRGLFGRWRTWSESARYKRDKARTFGDRNTPNQPNCGLTGLEIFDTPLRALA